MPPSEDDRSLYQQLGMLQGQMTSVLEQQQNAIKQTIQLEHKLTTEIDRLLISMNSRITTLEHENQKSKIIMARLKWNQAAISSFAAVIGGFASQLFFRFLPFS